MALKSANGDDKIISGIGDASNPFPGTLGKRDFTPVTTPNSNSYAGQESWVYVRDISDAGPTMKMGIAVQPRGTVGT